MIENYIAVAISIGCLLFILSLISRLWNHISFTSNKNKSSKEDNPNRNMIEFGPIAVAAVLCLIGFGFFCLHDGIVQTLSILHENRQSFEPWFCLVDWTESYWIVLANSCLILFFIVRYIDVLMYSTYIVLIVLCLFVHDVHNYAKATWHPTGMWPHRL